MLTLLKSSLSFLPSIDIARHLPPLPLKLLRTTPHSSQSPTSKNQKSSRLAGVDQLPNHHPFSHNILFLNLRSTTSLQEARKLHGLILVNGYLYLNHSPVLGSLLVNTYVNLGYLHEALLAFQKLVTRNSFAWNSILKGLVEVGRFEEALEFYHLMQRDGLDADNFTYPLALKACSGLSDLQTGRKIQEKITSCKPNVYVQCAVLDMFAKCGSLSEARRVFDEMPSRDLVSWSAMICGTMQNGEWAEALELFRRMRLEGSQVDSVIVATVLPACGRLGDVKLGMGLQSCAIKSGFSDDLCVSNALVDMYCKCGYIGVASQLFRFMEHKDVISWSSLIAGYSQNLQYVWSLDLLVEMIGLGIKPSSVTLAAILPSLSEGRQFGKGKEIHGYAIRHGFEFNKFVSSALIDLYCKCGSMREAEVIFEIMSDKDIAIANSMITGYAMKVDVDSVFQILRRIGEEELRPNSVTIVTVLPLCNHFTMLSQGKELHGYVIRGGLGPVVSVNNSLIDLYCKCGCLDIGNKVFQQMINRDIVSYNTIISAYGMHGHGNQAIDFFNQMRKELIHPDKVTFIALLSACSHAGLTDQGLSFYESMIEEHGILPDMEHYSCMVDICGRSGYLDYAWKFIQKMPIEPDIDVLGSLLAACRVHKRMDLAELIGRMIFEKRVEDPGYHVLLSNMYAATARWSDAFKVRMMIKGGGFVKKPGNSWIQIGSHIHSFLARDRSHPEFDQINEIMQILILEMIDEGYLPDMSFSHNLE